MKLMRKTFQVGISAILLSASLSLTACNKRVAVSPNTPANQTPVNQTPINNDPIGQDPLDGRDTFTNTPAAPTGVPNNKLNEFKVDQDTFNQWQAKGIAVTGGTIYVSAADNGNIFKKGTIIKMSASDGKNWKDLSSSFLGLRHPMDATVQGVAVAGGVIVAGDSQGQVYVVDASKGSVKKVKGTGANDVAAGSGGFFFANGSLEKSDASAAARSPLNGLSVSGGIGADNNGNVFAVSGNAIKKFDVASQQVFDVVTENLTGALDVAVDNRNGDIYVLEQANIKRFNSNGQFIVTFSNSATRAIGIATDETGAVYVADSGSTHKDSKVIKFSASIDGAVNNNMNSQMYNANSSYSAYNNQQYGAYNNDPYASYANTRRQ